MKVKQLAEDRNVLIDESIGDAHSHYDWAGFAEANLISCMAAYAEEVGYPNAYEFSKAMERMALENWNLVNEKYSDEVPF
jgi:hypothetical protein